MATIEKLLPSRSKKQGKRGRKFDRKRKRSASHARYNAEKRWLINKARRIKKNNSEVDYLAFRELHKI